MALLTAILSLLLAGWSVYLLYLHRQHTRQARALSDQRAAALVAEAQLMAQTQRLLTHGDRCMQAAQDIVQGYAEHVARVVAEIDPDAGRALLDEAAKARAQIEVRRVMERNRLSAPQGRPASVSSAKG